MESFIEKNSESKLSPLIPEIDKRESLQFKQKNLLKIVEAYN